MAYYVSFGATGCARLQRIMSRDNSGLVSASQLLHIG